MPEPRTPKPEDIFDVDRIRKLVDLMKEQDLAEIDLRQASQRICIRRGGEMPVVVAPSAMASAVSAPVAAALPATTPPADDTDGPHITIVRSPMVGTFYSRPNPNSKNFVEVGSEVGHDTTICIIEAMKVFNEIPAEVRGKVVAVLAKNEDTVDFGKPLFKVDTRG
jgi:acetyl-CoA carboxylase biotin carboxyl carrier protein